MHLPDIPRPSERNIALRVTRAAESALRDGHPWLYENSIHEQSKDGAAGDLAVIFDNKRRFLAVGLYDPESVIRVKVLQHGQSETINEAFFHAKVQAAWERRTPLLETDTNGYRVVHGENDGLPGLIVDRYDGVYVVKLYTTAWFPHLQEVLSALEQVAAPEVIVLRLSRNVQSGETFGLRDGDVIHGELTDTTVTFCENGLTFAADVIAGHKTGFFFDQRDNRQRVRTIAKDCRVLDVFAYNGGFAVYAAAGGATHVTSVDIAEPALVAARDNMALNSDLPAVVACEYHTLTADAFEALAQADGQYDLVIVDPPSFANSQDQIDAALHAYDRLVRLAVKAVRRGGKLMMASCSSRVSSEAFFAAVERGAQAAGRPLSVTEKTGHALDHPIGFPEGAYLKALFADVP